MSYILQYFYIPFFLSTCFNKNEKQAGAELGRAGNKLYRASHNRCWSYLVSLVDRISIKKISEKQIHADVLLWSAMFHLLTLSCFQSLYDVRYCAFGTFKALKGVGGWGMVQSVIGLFLYRLLALTLLLFSLRSFPVSFPVGWMGGWLDKLTKLSLSKSWS